jgi:uncharacterized protein YjiS (DUF1127 family)
MFGSPTRQCAPDSADSTLQPALLMTGLGLLGAVLERARQRRALQSLPDHMLQDIGLTRRDVEAECRRYFRR